MESALYLNYFGKRGKAIEKLKIFYKATLNEQQLIGSIIFQKF